MLSGQTEKTEIAKAEKMHGPGTLNVSFFIQSGVKMKALFSKFLKPDTNSQWAFTSRASEASRT